MQLWHSSQEQRQCAWNITVFRIHNKSSCNCIYLKAWLHCNGTLKMGSMAVLTWISDCYVFKVRWLNKQLEVTFTMEGKLCAMHRKMFQCKWQVKSRNVSFSLCIFPQQKWTETNHFWNSIIMTLARLFPSHYSLQGHAILQLAEALRYKPECHEFDLRYHWKFFIDNPSGPRVDSVSNRNE
jgi:hypothetical protein